MMLLWGAWLLINLLVFILYGVDKRRARKQQWRIPEKTLFLMAVLGGGLGTTLGMHWFRHKTKHWYFKYGMPAILLLEAAVLIYVMWMIR